MTEILAPISTANKLCGKQTVRAEMSYRLSRHCIPVECEDGRLLYHTMTGSICLVGCSERPELVRDELIEKWYMVPEIYDENKLADDVRQAASIIKPKARYKDHFTILTTTDCNARCRYCYELGRKRIMMTRETAEAAAYYMIQQSGGDRPLKLFWFGGEPLYNIPAIETITGVLRGHGIAFHSGMTSNGFYLTPDVVRTAKEEWNLESIQITIDGTEKVYNKIKAYIDYCDNPFKRVLDNIENALLSGIRVTIRLNVDSQNSKDISDVIDELHERFRGKGNCKIYVALLRPYKTQIAEFATEQERLACYFDLREKIRRCGMLRMLPLNRQIKLNRCKADNDACEIILPDGQLDRCHHYMEGEQIGSIFRDERDQHMIDAWKEVKKDYSECKTCPMYPICLNLKKCDMNQKGCLYVDREIYRKSLEEQVLIQYNNWKIGQTKRT